jgi:hypothetical protein
MRHVSSFSDLIIPRTTTAGVGVAPRTPYHGAVATRPLQGSVLAPSIPTRGRICLIQTAFLYAGMVRDMQYLRELLYGVYPVPEVISKDWDKDGGFAKLQGGEACMYAQRISCACPKPSCLDMQGLAMLSPGWCCGPLRTTTSSSWVIAPWRKERRTCCPTRYAL